MCKGAGPWSTHHESGKIAYLAHEDTFVGPASIVCDPEGMLQLGGPVNIQPGVNRLQSGGPRVWGVGEMTQSVGPDPSGELVLVNMLVGQLQVVSG